MACKKATTAERAEASKRATAAERAEADAIYAGARESMRFLAEHTPSDVFFEVMTALDPGETATADAEASEKQQRAEATALATVWREFAPHVRRVDEVLRFCEDTKTDIDSCPLRRDEARAVRERRSQAWQEQRPAIARPTRVMNRPLQIDDSVREFF